MVVMPSVAEPRQRCGDSVADPANRFWTAGREGELVIGRCEACQRLLHPSAVTCAVCGALPVEAVVSGKATVITHTVNAQRWPGSERTPPYVIAIVALDEDPAVRLTTNLVGVEPEAVVDGMPVQVRFEHHGERWVPVFAPATEAFTQIPAGGSRSHAAAALLAADPGPPVVRVRPPASPARFEHRVALTGVGASVRGRRLDFTETQLSLQACRAAVSDAGLELADIDGLAVYPGPHGMPGVSGGGARALEQALELRPSWHCGARETSGQTGVVIEAMLAVAAGLCRHVLCVNTVRAASLPTQASADDAATGEAQWRAPFGAHSPANWIALYANRYLARYGASRRALGWVAVTARAHAAGNPEALFTEPLTIEQYLGARAVSSPFGLYDCDVPCDGSIAFVVSERPAASVLRHPPVLVDAVGTAISEPQSWDQVPLSHQPGVFGAAAHLWSRASLTRDDVDVALLYDGFTFNVLSWIEALGFCGIGEGWGFVEGGRRIARDGELPLNPHGGQLSAGRSNGYGHLREAVLQLRDSAGPRQVPGAEVAVVTSGGGIPGGCMLLKADR